VIKAGGFNYLGVYRLLGIVSTGHHCQIWKAYDDGQSRPVAIKTLVERYRKSREHIGYLKREHEVGSSFNHERIVRVFAFATDRDVPYLAMEWFPATNLKSRIHQEPETVAPWITKIVHQASQSVAVFNGGGWVHRDIKPENFLVSDEGEVKLIDFSLAQRRKGFLAKWFTPRSKVQGTHSYISPEQIRGELVDERADLYSLGCTLFELLASRPPFTGTNANELLSKHLRATPPPLESACPEVNREFAQLIRRAMAKDPAARFRSTEVFYQAVLQTPVFRRVDPSGRAAGRTPT
jgi:serine/threonine protein kinase